MWTDALRANISVPDFLFNYFFTNVNSLFTRFGDILGRILGFTATHDDYTVHDVMHTTLYEQKCLVKSTKYLQILCFFDSLSVYMMRISP